VMTRAQYLLCKLAEECSEVAQRALKQQQFGPKQRQKGYNKNRDRLRGEVLDMLAHVKFLQDAGEIDRIGGDDVAIHAAKKWRKVQRFMGLSKRLGLVE
jgi:NTP pyrophosphatase (non-canonical NTP hydrolase)